MVLLEHSILQRRRIMDLRTIEALLKEFLKSSDGRKSGILSTGFSDCPRQSRGNGNSFSVYHRRSRFRATSDGNRWGTWCVVSERSDFYPGLAIPSRTLQQHEFDCLDWF
jgi:hypothetical protein